MIPVKLRITSMWINEYISGLLFGIFTCLSLEIVRKKSVLWEYPTSTTEFFRGLNGLREEYDLIIVGAGLSGSVVAQQASERFGLKSLVIDKRPHIGGNCFDFINEFGIRESKYGAHIFHTKNERVWNYVTRFSNWIYYNHKVKANLTGLNGNHKIVPVPPNQITVNELFGTNVSSESEMKKWVNQESGEIKSTNITNGEEMSIHRVGVKLYEKIFKHYTKKQWDKYPSELDPSVLARLPIRFGTNDRYFDDPWEALPTEGYTKLFENLLNNPDIDVRLRMDYLDVKMSLPKSKMTIFTGPIDAFYESKGLEKLEYRSIRFEREYHEPSGGFFQPAWVINYPGPEVDFTRIVEYKHMPNQPSDATNLLGTTIYKEFTIDNGDPYYPIPNPKNMELYKRYQEMASLETKVLFVGRLASYKYFNMDEAILAALEISDQLVDKIHS